MNDPLHCQADQTAEQVLAPCADASACVPIAKPELLARSVWKPVCLLFLFSVTLFGLQVAAWTSSAHLVQLPRLSAAINPMAHLFVFGLWTAAWGLCWKDVFAQKAGKLFLVLVPVALAFLGEVVEVFWPGHQFDVRDVLLNLVGVAIALWMGNRFTSLPRPAGNGPPGN